MKCQRCAKPATIHITEIIKGAALEFHLCEDHAQQQLQSDDPIKAMQADEKLKSKLEAVSRGKDTSVIDSQTCPKCGISFLEFRNAGRLGCPHDYDAFREELIPLLENIHGETQHAGKAPRRVPAGTKRTSEMVQLRQALRKAVTAENYEEAARLRDEIQKLEQKE